MKNLIQTVLKNNDLIGIFGAGISGQAVAKVLSQLNKPFVMFDVNTTLGKDFLRYNNKQDLKLIIYSPSFLQSHQWQQVAAHEKIPTISETDFGAYFWQGQIIAVTGTDGKTTVTSLLTDIFKNYSDNAISVGNIGIPLTSIAFDKINTKKSIAICEISSFQSEKIEVFSPNYTIFTNFAPDHLEKHKSLEDYFLCKLNLLRHTKTLSFIGESVYRYANLAGKNLNNISHKIVTKNEINKLREFANNDHTRENYALVENLCDELKIPSKIIKESVKNFTPPKFRLEGPQVVTRSNKTIHFWNDSKSTNLHSLTAALNSFNGKVILICGGKSKNEPLNEYIDIFKHKTKAILLIGETGENISQIISNKQETISFFHKFFGKNKNSRENIVKNIVDCVFLLAADEDVVLLSPGFSSLDMFQNYEERGYFFNKMFYN